MPTFNIKKSVAVVVAEDPKRCCEKCETDDCDSYTYEICSKCETHFCYEEGNLQGGKYLDNGDKICCECNVAKDAEFDLMLRYEVQVVCWKNKYVGLISNNLCYDEFPVTETCMWDTIAMWCDKEDGRHENIMFHTVAEKITKIQLKKFTNIKTAEEVIACCN